MTDQMIVPNPGKVKLAGWILDKHVGPDLRLLSKAALPPALDTQADTFGSWVLNQAFHGEFKDDKLRVLLSMFISRIWSARETYEAARGHLASYLALLDQTNTHVSRYRAAVREFEATVHHAHLGVTAMVALAPLLKVSPPYSAKDGSDYDRLRLMNNRIKHFDEDITAGKHTRVAPLWLTDTSLHTDGASVTYVELAEILDVHAQDARNFSEDFFADARARRKPSGSP